MIKPGQRALPGAKTGILITSVFIALSASSLSAPQESPPNIQPELKNSRPREGEIIRRRLTEYSIKARIPVLGNIGRVGTFAIEEEVRQNGDSLDRYFCISGRSMPELAKKGKDYSGSLEMVRTLPLQEGYRPEWPSAGGPGKVMYSSSGYFKKNGAIESESIVFFSDYALSMRENGGEKKVEGTCECLISTLEHFLECEVREGDVYESRIVLGGRPLIFRCEVGRATRLQSRGAKVFPIDFTTYDGLEKDGKGLPKVVKKKGGIRLWLCKDEPFKDVYLRLTIQYKWYLALQMEMVKNT